MPYASTLDYIAAGVLPAALWQLRDDLDSDAARALLLAIGLQESDFRHRTQLGGPARGFWQFELHGGVQGVLEHPATAQDAATACDLLHIGPTVADVYAALVHNDILAAIFARLLLTTIRTPLPRKDEEGRAWNTYIAAWRPGKPRPESWPAYWATAWTTILGPD